MTRKQPQMILSVSLDPAGHHSCAWRLPTFDPGSLTDMGSYLTQAQIAEEACLDFVLAGYPVRASDAASNSSGPAVMRLEPMSLAAALMGRVRQIGLAFAVPMSFWEPFNLARAFAAFDNLSNGRAGWLAVPSAGDADLQNYSRFARRPAADADGQIQEYLHIVRSLWDSWEDDALSFDKENAVFTDWTKVHRISYRGTYFSSDGPLNAPRPPQGHPVIMAAPLDVGGIVPVLQAADLLFLQVRDKAEARPAAALGAYEGPLRLVDLRFLLADDEAAAAKELAALDALGSGDAKSISTLTFAGTAEGLATLMAVWVREGACDGFNLMPMVMPRGLAQFGDKVLPLLRSEGLFRASYEAGTLRERLGLARPVSAHSPAAMAAG